MLQKLFRYPVSVRAIHWLGVVLIATAYLTSASAEELEEAVRGGAQWHVLAGLGLMLLFVVRVVARWGVHPPPIAGSRVAEVWMARTVHIALLLFMVVQPLIGILVVWSEGLALPVPFTPWELSPLVVVGERWEDVLEELHETIGNAFYAVIAVHVIAALWHQFVRRDGTLARML